MLLQRVSSIEVGPRLAVDVGLGQQCLKLNSPCAQLRQILTMLRFRNPQLALVGDMPIYHINTDGVIEQESPYADARWASIAAAFLSVLLFLTNESYAGNRDYAYEVKPSDCRTVSDRDAERVGAGWGRWLAYVKSCPVGRTNDPPVIHIISVWVDDYYASQPGTPIAEEIPLPLLVDQNGQFLGELPRHFPGEEATSLQVVFRVWRNGWPRRIDLFLFDLAAGGNRALKSMKWSAAKRRFE